MADKLRQDEYPLSDKAVNKVAFQIWEKLTKAHLNSSNINLDTNMRAYIESLKRTVSTAMHSLRQLEKACTFVPASALESPTRLFKAAKHRILKRLSDQMQEMIYSATNVRGQAIIWNGPAYRLTNTKNPLGLTHARWLKMITTDLKQLITSFGRERILWNSRLHILSAVTEDITLHSINFGPFKISLFLDNLPVPTNTPLYRCIALRPNLAYPGAVCTHPHVHQDVLCEGNGRERLAKLWKEGFIFEAVMLIRQILLNYNSNSPHMPIHKWAEKREKDSFMRRQRMLIMEKAREQAQALMGVQMPDIVFPSFNRIVPYLEAPGTAQAAAPANPRLQAINSGFIETEVEGTPAETAPLRDIMIHGESTQIRDLMVEPEPMAWCRKCDSFVRAVNVSRCPVCLEGACRGHSVLCEHAGCAERICALCLERSQCHGCHNVLCPSHLGSPCANCGGALCSPECGSRHTCGNPTPQPEVHNEPARSPT